MAPAGWREEMVTMADAGTAHRDGSVPRSRSPMLIVDAANVIGARPDGWWRDRSAAARRLLSALTRTPPADGDLVLVLEGQARAGVPEGPLDGVEVVHAPRSGDDRIVEIVRAAIAGEPPRPVTVVTADRGLRDRVTALGANTVGPRWLWERLEANT